MSRRGCLQEHTRLAEGASNKRLGDLNAEDAAVEFEGYTLSIASLELYGQRTPIDSTETAKNAVISD